MPSRTFGTLSLQKGEWKIEAEAHVLIRLKNVFSRINRSKPGAVLLANTPENCRDIEWFLERFPLEVKNPLELSEGGRVYRERLESLEFFNSPDYQPTAYDMQFPPREYQSRAIDIFRANGFLLLGDEMGLGKTATFACSLVNTDMLPALVVCDAHLPPQWQRELEKFLPGIRTHIIQKSKPYPLPTADVYICSYAKLRTWADVLMTPNFLKTVCYDEIQALRHNGTAKYLAAQAISNAVQWKMGLSGTPIYGYGEEIFNVFDGLKPGLLGERDEFQREWLTYAGGGKYKFQDADAFGAYAAQNFYMLNRTRKDVGRELPPLTRIPHTIAFDEKALDAIKGSAMELARLILDESTSFVDKGQASRQFDLRVRQATGIAKAPYAAAFIKMLIDDGKRPVCFAWHREVYNIMAKELKDYNPVFYTGEESPIQKDTAVQKFVKGESRVIFLSTRAGAGLNGLQDVSDTTVHVELDWAPAVHDQNICRVFRDRSDGTFNNNVFSYFLLSDTGSDPVMADILNLKQSEISGLMRPGDDTLPNVEIDPNRIKQMAADFLAKHHQTHATRP